MTLSPENLQTNPREINFYKEILKSIEQSTSLGQVLKGLIDVFGRIKEVNPSQEIGYVAGIITSDGEERMQQNIERLAELTERIRTKFEFPVFSSVDIFGSGIYDRIKEFRLERNLREKSFIEFWRAVFESGHITDVFMTPRWEESRGAKDEHETAKQLGLKIHYVDSNLNELEVS